MRPGQRRLAGGVFAEHGGAPEAQMRLDLLHQHPAEHVGPGVVGGGADPRAIGQRRPGRRGPRPRLAPAGRSRHSGRRPRRASAARASAIRIAGSAPASDSVLAPAASAASPRSAAQSAISGLVGLPGPIPFQHRELRAGAAGPRSRLRHTRARSKIRARPPPAASWPRTPARCADRAGCARPYGWIASVAKACRWASLPGETCRAGVSTSTKSRAANQADRANDPAPRHQERAAVGVPVGVHQGEEGGLGQGCDAGGGAGDFGANRYRGATTICLAESRGPSPRPPKIEEIP